MNRGERFSGDDTGRLFLFGKEVLAGEAVGDRRWEMLVSNLERMGFWRSGPVVVFVDFRINVRNIVFLLRRKRAIRVLVQVEPRSVNPWQFSWVSKVLFSHFICDADFAYRFSNAHEWSPGFDVDFSRPLEGDRTASVGMLAGNKFSFVKGSQYGLRKKILKSIKAEGIEVVLGGRGWGRSKWTQAIKAVVELLRPFGSGVPYLNFSSFLNQFAPFHEVPYVGEVSESHEFWETVDFAVVVENEQGVMSEKLFEATSAGCGLIYVGKSLGASPYALQLSESLDSRRIMEFLKHFPREFEEVRRVNSNWLAESVPSCRNSFENLAEKIMELINDSSGPQ